MAEKPTGRIKALCPAAADDSMTYSDHYIRQRLLRPTPSKAHIVFMLCLDSPKIIENYPEDERGGCCLIRGVADHGGRIGHVLCAYPPNSKVITAYFPRETEPNMWDNNYQARQRMP